MTRLTVIRPDGQAKQEFPIYGDAARFGNERSIYFVKRLPDGSARAYDRQYELIGTIEDGPSTIGAVTTRYMTDMWRDYDGGSDGLRGFAVWLEEK